jgi:hypothetical protein
VKRFILFAPDQANNLYLYPFLHPGAQQSQVSFDAPDLRLFPQFASARALEAVLQPGDVLYLPPLWFHHVSALTSSMSVSVWTRFPETQEMYKTVKVSLPIRAAWSPETRLMAARIYLLALIAVAMPESSTTAASSTATPSPSATSFAFLERLVDQRYRPLARTMGAQFLPESESFCDAVLRAKADMRALEIHYQELVTHATQHAQLFLRANSTDRRAIWLGNMCEQLSLTITGNVHLVSRFLIDLVEC